LVRFFFDRLLCVFTGRFRKGLQKAPMPEGTTLPRVGWVGEVLWHMNLEFYLLVGFPENEQHWFVVLGGKHTLQHRRKYISLNTSHKFLKKNADLGFQKIYQHVLRWF